MKMRAAQSARRFGGFTLLEIMMVVAIMGLVVAMGMPSFVASMKKEGMRKALDEITEVCRHAREQAILRGVTTSVTFHPVDGTFHLNAPGGANQVTGGKLPDSVQFAMLDINLDEFVASPDATVFFYPNGTSDEMTIVLHSSTEWKKISLEYATALAVVSDVDK